MAVWCLSSDCFSGAPYRHLFLVNKVGFEETIIHCSAPALCGIKPASLFSMSSDCYRINCRELMGWRTAFSKAKRFFVPVKKDNTRILFFVYDKKLLEEVCSKRNNIKYLKSKGYPVNKGFNSILSELIYRLAHQENFPHETGLFLGYPLEDVLGFEANRAQGFIYSGFWKVYGNKQAAISMMNKYKACTELCMLWLKQGLSVPLAAQKYCSVRA